MSKDRAHRKQHTHHDEGSDYRLHMPTPIHSYWDGWADENEMKEGLPQLVYGLDRDSSFAPTPLFGRRIRAGIESRIAPSGKFSLSPPRPSHPSPLPLSPARDRVIGLTQLTEGPTGKKDLIRDGAIESATIGAPYNYMESLFVLVAGRMPYLSRWRFYT
ncbi:hypothetical protein SUGI_1503290 [Cryptomeria japonica]|uniref:Uncharacterized protein n=1 Tax=Cryptomeria japonica TaxID=3369 RepID=A0AAD3NUR6_CRYJA|nr:hypothetical protein SUGI_1449590 [Cryptomeria japonica]GLJ59332.1 hypothetical protein SUGI_1503290 [Cryptomeria japonica]